MMTMTLNYGLKCLIKARNKPKNRRFQSTENPNPLGKIVSVDGVQTRRQNHGNLRFPAP